MIVDLDVFSQNFGSITMLQWKWVRSFDKWLSDWYIDLDENDEGLRFDLGINGWEWLGYLKPQDCVKWHKEMAWEGYCTLGDTRPMWLLWWGGLTHLICVQMLSGWVKWGLGLGLRSEGVGGCDMWEGLNK